MDIGEKLLKMYWIVRIVMAFGPQATVSSTKTAFLFDI
jgi:hypothetical protein